jgi:hypothetical protein
MPLDPDHQPGAEPTPEADPEPTRGQGPDSDGDGVDPPDNSTVLGPEGRLAAVYRQWRTQGRPSGTCRVLVRTTPEDPDGLPFLELLGVEDAAVDDAWSVWDQAQLASDATPLGRAARPLVALVPAGGRWIAGRSMGRLCLLEPIDHGAPAAALRAAEVRYRLLAARRLGDAFDELMAALDREDEAEPAPYDASDATAPEPDDALLAVDPDPSTREPD